MTVYRGKTTMLPQPQNQNNGVAKQHQHQQHHRSKPLLRSSGNNNTRRSTARIRTWIMLASVLLVSAGSLFLSYGVFTKNAMQQHEQQQSLQQSKSQTQTRTNIEAIKVKGGAGDNIILDRSSAGINHDKCAFRSYPSNRLYGLPSKKSQPNFLSDAAYIRGQHPIIINPIENDNAIISSSSTSSSGSSSHTTTIMDQTPPVKVCLDTTSWENLVGDDGKKRLPFTDGHNPSVISLAPNPYSLASDPKKKKNDQQQQQRQQQHVRLDPAHLSAVASAFPSDVVLDSLFMSVSIFGGGQCKFGFTPEQTDEYRNSLHEEPQGGKRAVIAVLAPPSSASATATALPFRTLAQTTLLLERDAAYGAGPKRSLQPEKVEEGGFARMHQEFDDPRLFFHLGRVWVLYRNGPLFGYKDQIHNPIHFEEAEEKGGSDGGRSDGDVKFVAYVKASETVRVCCGRNIALISEEPLGRNDDGEVEWVSNPKLKALTWVDPVTVKDDINIDDVEAKLKNNNRRLLEVGNDGSGRNGQMAVFDISEADSSEPNFNNRLPAEHHRTPRHRRLGSKPNKSNIHGTNGYMVPLPSTGELMGIAHFHRPENRKSSEFALHGHHYTHAFFTIARQGDAKEFKLKRLSNEFVFRANSVPAGDESRPPTDDGDIIQFASGLDVVGSDVEGSLIISYGINDCEGGVFTMAMVRVQKMLIEVGPGQEVVDVMETAKR